MRINQENISKKLAKTPPEKRVWIYNASIILEFLNHIFIPTRHFLADQKKAMVAGQLDRRDYVVGFEKDYSMRAADLYNKYLWYRENKDYTSPIETLFKFKVILNKMRWYKNGWEFTKLRRGRDQDVYFAPLLAREKAPDEVRLLYPVPETNVEAGKVDVELEDLESEPQKIINPESEIKKLDEGQYINE